MTSLDDILDPPEHQLYLEMLHYINNGTMDRYLMRLKAAIDNRINPDYQGRHRNELSE